VGTPFAGWSKAKAALDKAGCGGRRHEPHANIHDRPTVATGQQHLGVTEAV
jgi:hypothetical protein